MAGITIGSVEVADVLAKYAGAKRLIDRDCVAGVIEVYRAAGVFAPGREIISRAAAVRLLRDVAGDLSKAAGAVIEGLGWPEISPDAALNLDCGVCALWDQETMAIHYSGRWIAPGPDGVVWIRSALRAWRSPIGGSHGY